MGRMTVEIIGSGGAVATPRSLCSCRVCSEARMKGPPYSRSGPSTFVHGPDLLIDTPEEIRLALDRSAVTKVGAAVYSHWHPDHTRGIRVFESLNADWRSWPPEMRGCTDIYLPEQVVLDFERFGLLEALQYLEGRGLVRVVRLRDGETFELNGVTVTPFRLSEDYVYGFVIEGERRVLIVPDETFGWEPSGFVTRCDLAIVPKGFDEHDPLTGERRLPPGHELLQHEATFEWTRKMLPKLKAGRVVLTHIEEADALTYDDYLELEERLAEQGEFVTFAYDGQMIEV